MAEEGKSFVLPDALDHSTLRKEDYNYNYKDPDSDLEIEGDSLTRRAAMPSNKKKTSKEVEALKAVAGDNKLNAGFKTDKPLDQVKIGSDVLEKAQQSTKYIFELHASGTEHVNSPNLADKLTFAISELNEFNNKLNECLRRGYDVKSALESTKEVGIVQEKRPAGEPSSAVSFNVAVGNKILDHLLKEGPKQNVSASPKKSTR